VLACLLAASLAFTWWALEASGVAVVTTQTGASARTTHVWYVRDSGELLVEAGTPGNGWYQDIQDQPRLRLVAADLSGTFIASPLPNPAGHERVRRLLRNKYGLRDRWIAGLFDTTRSVAVLMQPAEPKSAADGSP
jgi:hypothetical protein